MENHIKILKSHYGCTYRQLAMKIGITERQLYNVIKGNCGRFLKEKIENMVAETKQKPRDAREFCPED